MPEVFPSWKETREKLLNAGISEAEIDKGLARMKARVGPMQTNTDALYFMTARVIFKIEMPKVTSLKRGGSDAPGQRITCKDITPKMAVEATEQDTKFEIYGFVYNARAGTTRNGKPQFSLTLFDHTGSIDIIAYSGKDGGAYQKFSDLELQNGDFIHIDHLQVEYREWTYEKGDRKGQKGSAISCKVPPWANPTKVLPPDGYGIESCFKDASTQLINDGEMAIVRGFVTDDDMGLAENGAISWTSCTVSGRKVDKDTQVCEVDHEGPCMPEDRSFRAISVSPGGKIWTVQFSPENHPKESNLEGSVITAFCRYEKKFNKYQCLWFEIGAERQLKTARDVLAYGEEEAEPEEPPKTKPVSKNVKSLQAPPPTEQPKGGPVAEKRLQVTQVPPKIPAKPKEEPWHENLENLKRLHDFIYDRDDGKGAPWEELIEPSNQEFGIDENTFEEAVNGLMELGYIYEPVLGRLRTQQDGRFFEKEEAKEEPAEEEEAEITTEQVVREIGVPVEGWRLSEIQKALEEKGYEKETLEALLEDNAVVKKGMRYFAAGQAAPEAAPAPEAPKKSPEKAAPPAPKAPPTPAPAKASKGSGGGKLPPTSLPEEAQQVLIKFVGNFRQNPVKAVVRKLKEKCPDHDPEDLLKQAESDGWITFDPEIAKEAGCNNPGGTQENPNVFWAVK